MRHLPLLLLGSVLICSAPAWPRTGKGSICSTSIASASQHRRPAMPSTSPATSRATAVGAGRSGRARHHPTSNARLPAHSDSFPGLLALVTGGSPVSHGVFYDVSYDRTLFDPTNVTHGPGGQHHRLRREHRRLRRQPRCRRTSSIPASCRAARRATGGACPSSPTTSSRATRSSRSRARPADRPRGPTSTRPRSGQWAIGQGCRGPLHTRDHQRRGFDATASVVCTAKNDKRSWPPS